MKTEKRVIFAAFCKSIGTVFVHTNGEAALIIQYLLFILMQMLVEYFILD
jgi:hypothetical protein